jgi:hypothetical protein
MAYNKLSNYRTTWFDNGDHGGVTYAQTNIVSWRDGVVTLKSGGWETVTTKRKMNQAAMQFGLNYGVYQKDYDWFVDLPNGETVPFKDGMTFEATA